MLSLLVLLVLMTSLFGDGAFAGDFGRGPQSRIALKQRRPLSDHDDHTQTCHGTGFSDLHNGIAAAATNASFITALTNRPEPPYLARFQCWKLNESFSGYPTIGSAVSLGVVHGDVKLVKLPAGGAEGWHRPPSIMFFVILSGSARSYVPVRQGTTISSPSDAEGGSCEPGLDDPNWERAEFVPGGVNQVIVAADVDARAKGHLTFYAVDKDSTALQIPLREGILPGYVVMHEGPCDGSE
jgi:hypothetical protein